MPGAVGAELKTGASDAASRTFVDDFYKQAIPADSIARVIEQPADVGEPDRDPADRAGVLT
jgi:hypothetical protein